MVKKVGCDRFISKFQPDLLVDVASSGCGRSWAVEPGTPNHEKKMPRHAGSSSPRSIRTKKRGEA